jgi:hypothetical protein
MWIQLIFRKCLVNMCKVVRKFDGELLFVILMLVSALLILVCRDEADCDGSRVT